MISSRSHLAPHFGNSFTISMDNKSPDFQKANKSNMPSVDSFTPSAAVRNSKLQFGARNALHTAAAKGDLRTIHTLVRTNPDYLNEQDEDGNTPLHHAAREGALDTVRVLLGKRGIERHARNHNNESPIEVAASEGHVEITQLIGEEYRPHPARAGSDFRICSQEARQKIGG